MKTPITKALLKQKVRAENKSNLSVIVVPAIFALACIALVPVKAIGIGIAVVVMLLVFLYLRKLRSLEPTGNPDKAYLRKLPMTAKKEQENSDPDSAGNAYSTMLLLYFGDDYAEVNRSEYEQAQPGDLYYVAFFSENSRAFACFSCNDFEPDGTVEVR